MGFGDTGVNMRKFRVCEPDLFFCLGECNIGLVEIRATDVLGGG